MDDVITFLGGPFDGAHAEAPEHAGLPILWVWNSHRVEGWLTVCSRQQDPEAVQYILTGRNQKGYFVYSYGNGSGDFLPTIHAEEPIAA